MPQIMLPDGSRRDYDRPVSVQDIAGDIGPGLAKAALAGKVDGRLVDTSYALEDDAEVAVITARDPEGLEIIRHSTAHLLAHAVKQLYPDAQVTIGPVIDGGFYYDFSYDRPFTPEDLEKIEARMNELAERDVPVSREVMPRDEAVTYFKNMGELYKAEIIGSIPRGETISLYRQGDFVDLCRGPHVPSTGKLKAFKLTKVAGAYWRGDSHNEMLQRIYGTSWPDKKQLKAYLHQLEEAEKRDHRRLGRELDLFHQQDEAVGSVFWHPRGWTLYRLIESYMRERLETADYVEVKTPQLLSRGLWEASGHWDKFRENMFTVDVGGEPLDLAIKPMNCPAHVQIYNRAVRSYRELPLRMAEFGSCHRYEPSGALHGLMRVRAFTQDDAHIFCTEEQINAETQAFCDLLLSVYRDFGFDDVRVKFSDRPPVRAGDDAIWDRAETALKQATAAAALETEVNPGEGAFYGPKLEFVLRDAIGREWQCGTLQVDFVVPDRLHAEYTAEDGVRRCPVMLHRAILGSFERFIGILIEHYEGKFPLWLAPVQAMILTITDRQDAYAEEVAAQLAQNGLRVSPDLRNEKVGFKIREHTMQGVPYLLIVGDKESESATVAVRARDGRDLGSMSIDQVIDRLSTEVVARGRHTLED